MKTKTYHANRYFDDLLVFEKSVPTSQDVDHKELLKTLEQRYIQAFMVAIRKLDKDERPLFQQFLFSGQNADSTEGLHSSMTRV